MAIRIEIYNKSKDTRALTLRKKLGTVISKPLTNCQIVDVYTIDKKISDNKLQIIATCLTNPLTQISIITSQNNKQKVLASKSNLKDFDFAIEIGFLPGVTDNIATTTKELIQDLLKLSFNENESIYTSQIIFIKGNISKYELKLLTSSLYNPVIQRIIIKTQNKFIKESGMEIAVPKVKINKKPNVTLVDLNVTDEELIHIGKFGIANSNGSRRGPFALDLTYMRTIQKYFQKIGRKPTDIEIESLAQTWSEHCKHTIFAETNSMKLKTELYKTLYKTCDKQN